jgi:hypothetical protein
MPQVRIANVAEQAINKFSDDIYLWLRDKCNIKLRPNQQVAADEYLRNKYAVHVWPPRFGKTTTKEWVNLYESATTPFEDGRIWGPGDSQAKEALKYQLEAIESSEILTAYIKKQNGKRLKSTKGYTFYNQSNWKTFGQHSRYDGENATIIDIEELDDMDRQVINDRIVPRGGAKNRNNRPTRIRMTGTIQEGEGPIYHYDMVDKDFHTITKFDIYDGLVFGIYDSDLIAKAKRDNVPDDWLRIYLLKYTKTRNFIWHSRIRDCQRRGMILNGGDGYHAPIFDPDGHYRAQGKVIAGMDMGASGQKTTSSKYSFVVYEFVGNSAIFLHRRVWDPTTDVNIVMRDIVDIWRFFDIDYAYGDALKADTISRLNDVLYDQRLISIDRREFPENTPSNWRQWAFSPVWNDGKSKWTYGQMVRNHIHANQVVFPYFDSKSDHPNAKNTNEYLRCMNNIREERTAGKYPRLTYKDPQIGDDDFDATYMCFGCANDHLEIEINFDQVRVAGQKTITSDLFSDAIAKQINIDKHSADML